MHCGWYQKNARLPYFRMVWYGSILLDHEIYDFHTSVFPAELLGAGCKSTVDTTLGRFFRRPLEMSLKHLRNKCWNMLKPSSYFLGSIMFYHLIWLHHVAPRIEAIPHLITEFGRFCGHRHPQKWSAIACPHLPSQQHPAALQQWPGSLRHHVWCESQRSLEAVTRSGKGAESRQCLGKTPGKKHVATRISHPFKS